MKKKKSAGNRHTVFIQHMCKKGTVLLLGLVLTVSGIFGLASYAASSDFDTDIPLETDFPNTETPMPDETAMDTAATDLPSSNTSDTVSAADEPATIAPQTDATAADTPATEPSSDTSWANTHSPDAPATEPTSDTTVPYTTLFGSKTDVADTAENETLITEESQTEVSAFSALPYQTMALETLHRIGLADAFGTGTVPADLFTAEKDGELFELSADWPGLASGSLHDNNGAIRSSLFPKIDGYHIVSATVHGTAIRHIGTLTTEIHGQEMTFVYYSADPVLNEQSVTVLEDGEKIILHYAMDEFDITYTVTGDSEGLSLDDLFGKNRPLKTLHHGYTLNVNVPRGYTGIIYINEKFQLPDGGYGYLRLGSDPEYAATATGAAISGNSLPRFFSRSGRYTCPNVSSAQRVNLLMAKRGSFTEKYQFDPHFWLQATGVTRRIASDVISSAVQINDVNPDGSYSYTWNFHTVVIPNEWITYTLRTLEINGESVAVPFFESSPGNPNVSVETTLTSGTHIRLTLTRIEEDDLSPSAAPYLRNYLRYYTMEITNAAESLTITGGTVSRMSSSHNVLRTASGVSVQYYIPQSGGGRWTDKKHGDLTPASSLGTFGSLGYGRYITVGSFQGNVRFRPLSGFHTSGGMVTFLNSSGKSINVERFTGPDSDGWYYIKLNANATDAIHPTSLEIKAAPNRYAVRYLPGNPVNGTVENMPEFSGVTASLPTHTDTNNGSFYLLNGTSATSDTAVPIASAPTNGAAVPSTFLSWALTDENGNLASGNASDMFSYFPDAIGSLREMMSYAVYDRSLDLWLINLAAQWQNNRFQYFIDLQWSTPDGVVHTQNNAATIATTSGAQRDGQKLRFVLSKDADVITDFLKSHPGYRLSPDNTYLFDVADSGHTTIKFEQLPARLDVTKKLLDEDKNEISVAREFSMVLTLSYPEGATAFDGANLSGQPLSADYNGDYPYTVTNASGEQIKKTLSLADGRGAFSLKPGETAAFAQLPAGTDYDVKEESLEGFSTEYQEKYGALQASSTAHAVVINRRTVPLTIRKLVIGDSADPDKKWGFTVTMYDGDDEQTDTFSLGHNESFVLKGWPAGTTFTITETGANQNGYETIVTGAENVKGGTATGTLRDAKAENGITVTYTNAYTNAALTLMTLTKRQLVNGKESGEHTNVLAGDTVTYELTLSNVGNVPATNITLADAIPAGLVLNETSISDAGSVAAGTVTWTIPSLDAQQKKTVRFTITVPSEKASATWTNQALARYDNAPEDPGKPGTLQEVHSNQVILSFEKSGGEVPETKPSPETNPSPEPESEPKPSPETNPSSETESEPESSPETNPSSETETEANSETENRTETQSATESSESPKTADDAPVSPWLFTAFLAFSFLVVCLHCRRKDT